MKSDDEMIAALRRTWLSRQDAEQALIHARAEHSQVVAKALIDEWSISRVEEIIEMIALKPGQAVEVRNLDRWVDATVIEGLHWEPARVRRASKGEHVVSVRANVSGMKSSHVPQYGGRKNVRIKR